MNAGARLQLHWRWNGKPLRVQIRRRPRGGWSIAWLRDHPLHGWREWRCYVGAGDLRDVIRAYRDYADYWRGRAW